MESGTEGCEYPTMIDEPNVNVMTRNLYAVRGAELIERHGEMLSGKPNEVV
jgi:hypothetical protein